MSPRNFVPLVPLAALLFAACASTPRVQAPREPAPSTMPPQSVPAQPAPPAVPPPAQNGNGPAACAPCAPCPPAPQCPGAAPVTPAIAAKPLVEASWRDVPGWGSDDLAPALGALLESCKASKSGLPAELCADAAKLVGTGNPRLQQFFESRFVPHQVVNADGTREGLITGYYEPLLKGSRKRSKANAWPLYGVPDDLLTIELGDQFPDLKGARVRGRLDGRKVVPYWTREEIAQREKQNGQFSRDVLFWLADPIEAFFLQVQGSGRIDLDDGTRVRVAYADQNGHPYRSIGRWLVDKGELKVEQASLEGIRNWVRANPSRLDELLNANPSYVFFREAPTKPGVPKDAGPAGTLGVPLTPGRSLAVDPRAIPLGAPVWLATTHPTTGKPLQRLMNAQDTGGAIKGGVRADFFWGFGAEAGAQAGRMRPSGRLWVLLPRSAP